MIGALADWFAVVALFRHPARAPDPAHRHHPQAQGPDRAGAGDVRPGELPHQGERRGTGPGRRAGGEVRHLARGSRQRRPGRPSGHRGARRHHRQPRRRAAGRSHRRHGARAAGCPPVRPDGVAGTGGGHRRRAPPGAGRRLHARGVPSHRGEPGRVARGGRQSSPWWVPRAVDEAVLDRAITVAHRFIVDVGETPGPPAAGPDRRAHRRAGGAAPGRPGAHRQGRGGQVRDPRQRSGADLPHRAVGRHQTLDPRSGRRPGQRRCASRVESSIAGIGRSLRTDPELRARVEEWLERIVGELVDRFQDEFSELVRTTVDRWDAAETGSSWRCCSVVTSSSSASTARSSAVSPGC